ncbi:MAG: hypothetical protein WBA10_12105 [Elainellaceae cyanobacterium]
MAIWNATLDFSEVGHHCKVTLDSGGNAMTFAEVIRGWTHDPGFRQFYISLVAEMPFEAVFWEAPAVTLSSIDRVYECMLLKSNSLDQVDSDPDPFDAYFRSAADDEAVVAFENLGGDAWLVVPCPEGPAAAYTHFAKFVREAPDPQRHEFFRVLGCTIEAQLSDEPLWINTSGLGVHWLHVRLDSQPKYYTFAPYKAMA